MSGIDITSWLDYAERISADSNCNRLKVGAVIIREKPIGISIVSHGFNYSPNGLPAENEDGSMSMPWVIHAEVNVITHYMKQVNKFTPNEDIIFVTHSPCVDCARLIFLSGIKYVVYRHEYRLKDGIELLRKLGVSVHKESDIVKNLKNS